MNKIYDKLLFAVGVFALLGGIGFYVTQTAESPSVTLPVGEPMAHPYQAIPVPASSAVAVSWPEAAVTSNQPPLELYDVFTPPKIWVNADGTFGFDPPIDSTLPPPPFGVYLAKIERDPYRIQIEGYIEEDLKDASQSLVLLYDEERQQQVRARVGKKKSRSDFTLLDFTIDRARDVDGNVHKTVIATLLDHRLGKRVVLTHGERLYNNSLTIVFRSNEDPSVEIILEEAPKEFETTTAKYVLQDIDLAGSSVTVKKLANLENATDEEVKTLYLNTVNGESVSAQNTVAPIAAESQPSDFPF
jgi:hypothetical protein